jgi:fluoroquinolone resistance protein
LTVDLSPGEHYIQQVFSNLVHLNHRMDENEFQDCTFENCNFAEGTFKDCRFIETKFVNCDLSLIQVSGCFFSEVQFRSSKCLGIDWTLAIKSKTRLQKQFDFQQSSLNHSTFIGMDLPEIQFQECSAQNVDFRECNLTRANFAETDLSQALFQRTNLTEADFRKARNYMIDPLDNTLSRARFSMPEALALLYSLDIELDDQG